MISGRRRRPVEMGARCNVFSAKFNDSACQSWPSRFISVILIVFLAQAITTTAQNSSQTSKIIDPPPLQISTHDVTLKVGSSFNVLISPTINFEPVFQNTSDSVVLVFRTSQPGIIQPLDNITLVAPSSNQADSTAVSGPVVKNSTLHVVALKAGQITVISQLIPNISNYSPKNIFLRVAVYKLETLILISKIVGWIYFFAWSISFYPQIIQNYQRKSVRGLSLDFVFLNITGFAVYSIYNVGLYWFNSIKQEYYIEYPQGVIPVQLNDVVFSLHALFACTIIVIQCIIYDRGSQTISDSGKMLLCTFFVFIFVISVVAASQAISWLTFLTWCSYVKLVITLIKYMPQAYLNWYRKSTSGWCIGNVLLDFTGGVFSLVQMIMIAYNHNDWSSFFGDTTKFGLGLFSILFDVFFIVQHYVLYKNHAVYEPIEGGDFPADSNQYGEITTSNHHFTTDSLDGDNGNPTSNSDNNVTNHYYHDNDNNTDDKEPASSPSPPPPPSSSSTVKITGNQVPVQNLKDKQSTDMSDSENHS